MMFTRKRQGDEGTALVEFATVFALLLVIALGAFEYGMLFRDWLSATVSTREGARVAASAGPYTGADCTILEASAGALQSLESGDVAQVHIYESDGNGIYPTNPAKVVRYRPAQPSEPSITCGAVDWFKLPGGGQWTPSNRMNIDDPATAADEVDWIGVRVVFDHIWMTDFLWWSGSATFTDDAVFRLEPPAPN